MRTLDFPLTSVKIAPLGEGGALKKVRIYRWRSPDTRFNNFGDEITVPILQRVFGIEAVPSEPDQADLIATGSILEHGSPKSLCAKVSALWHRAELHVWGSGFIQPDSRIGWRRKMRFHAVRGDLTADRVGASGPLGDPGILASLLIERVPKVAAVGIVPHYIDAVQCPPRWKAIDPMRPVDDVLRDIASCELIVSSSLHGLIAADSFGIPCVWANTDKPLYGSPNYKFLDYATGRRANFNEPISYAEAMASNDLHSIATVPNRPIAEWQRELAAAFPA
jgi:pyruvyltransferase